MEETLHKIHAHENSDGAGHVERVHGDDGDEVVALDPAEDGHVEEHLSKLGVRQGESPQSEVTGGVGNRSESEFDDFDQLVDKNLAGAVAMLFSDLGGVNLPLEWVVASGNCYRGGGSALLLVQKFLTHFIPGALLCLGDLLGGSLFYLVVA